MGKNKLQSVQALRGLAVLIVVLFHLKIWSFGYVGVDLFFAISGFVISASVIRTRNLRGDFGFRDFTDFLHRRARRIYPPMLVIISATMIMAIFQMTWLNEAQKKISAQAINSILGFSNFYLYQASTNYFSSDIAHKPLLHLWSISVELQFYLVFGLTLWIIGKIRAHGFIKLYGLVAVILLSFVFNTNLGRLFGEKLGISAWDSFKFYSSVNRIWEFGYGILVFLFFNSLKKEKKDLHLMMMFLAISFLICLSSSVALEVRLGLLTLPTTLFLSRIFPILTRPSLFSFIGDRSYSIYLWHMPVIFFFYYSRETMYNLIFTVIVLSSLSHITYRYVENSIRPRQDTGIRFQKNVMISLALISISSFILLSALIPKFIVNNSINSLSSSHLADAGWESSFGSCARGEVFNNSCSIEASNQDRVIFGDSHAGSFVQVQASNSEIRYFNASLIFPGCSAILPQLSSNKYCANFNSEIKKLLKQKRSATIVFSEDYALYGALYSKSDGKLNCTPYESCALQGLEDSEYFGKFNSWLNQVGGEAVEKVVVIGASPRLIGWPLQFNLWNVKLIGRGQINAKMEIEIPQKINTILKGKLQVSGLLNGKYVFVDPTDYICKSNTSKCQVLNEKRQPLYWDADHLSTYGAQKIFDNVRA